MAASDSSVSRDLFQGLVHGLGLAAAVWTVPDSTLLAPGCLALVLAAGAAGVFRLPPPLGAGVWLHYPFVLATLMLWGLGPAVLGAALGSCVGTLAHPARWSTGRGRRAAFEAGRAALVVAFAGLVWSALGGGAGEPSFPELLRPLLGYALAYTALDVALTVLEMRSAGIAASRRPWLLSRALLWLAGAGLALLGVALAEALPGTRLPLLVAPLLGAAWVAGTRRARRPVGRRRAATLDAHQAIARALARARIGDDTRAADHLDRVRRLAVSIGERMELDAYELDGLATAALLHDVGRIAVPLDGRGGAIAVHPSLGGEILDVIDFPYPVREYVAALGERWDGSGRPRGLRGDAIPVGARILAAVDWYDRQEGSGNNRAGAARGARARLRAEAGVRFDPLVVDLLLDAVDREAQLDAPFAGTAAADDHAGLRRADRDLQMLYGLGRDLSLPLDLGQRLTLAATRLASAVPFDGLAVAVEGAADGPPAIRFAHGPAGARLRRRLAGRSRGDARVGHDGRTGPEVPLPEGKTLALPLVDGELRPGTLWLYREQGPPFDARERALLVSVAGRLAGTLSRAAGAAREPRRDRSLTDPTTGLPNGRYLRLHCAHRLAADDARFGLVALQLRGLQEVGERRGAAAVDRLLAHAARRLAEAVRKRDLAARFGPDQFVVLTDEHEAGALVTAWTRLAAIVEEGVASIAGGVQVRVAGAHAVYPETGPGIEELLAELGRRLPEPRRERSVVPFRATASAS